MLFERRLLHQGQHGKWLLALAGIAAVAGGVLALYQAQLFSRIIQRVFLDGQSVGAVEGVLLWLAGVLVFRALLQGGQDLAATAAAFRIKQAVRENLIHHLSKTSYLRPDSESSGEVSQVIIEGVEALEPYFAQYLPQILVALIVPPILCIAVFWIDPLSGIVFLITAPLIPLFMRLIGDVAERQTRRQWGRLSQLSAFLFDALQGLTTIKRLGKSEEIAIQLAERSDQYRQATLETLRTTFLSALVMEFLTTLSTAVVAVQVGLRLLYGFIPFEQALFVLVIAPEFYLPLRLLGQRFHAGMSGVTAWSRIAKLFELPLVEQRTSSEEDNAAVKAGDADVCPEGIVFQTVSFAYPGRQAILKKVTATLRPGQITVLIGESGSGKTTLLNLLLRLLQPTEGQIFVNGKPIETISLSQWWKEIGYAPQLPFLYRASIRENLSFTKPQAAFSDIQRAAQIAYADEFIQALPQGYETLVGENGYGLSSGEKQRLVLARALLKDAPLLILDESTANIDPQTLEKILSNLRQSARRRLILIVSHQPQVWEVGHRYWVLQGGEIKDLERDEFLRLQQQAGISVEERVVQPSTDLVNPPVREQVFDLQLNPPEYKKDLPAERAFAEAHGIWRQWLSHMWYLRGWVLLAVFLGWAAILSNVGLMSTSAYIISFAALQPSIALLQTAIVGVRFFGISRGVFRYLERLTSHRVTLDLLSRMRVWFYRAMEVRVPQLFGKYGSGELLSRLIGDIASLEPFYVRAIAPLMVAILVTMAMIGWLQTLDPILAQVVLICYLIGGLGLIPLFYSLTVALTAPNNALRGQLSEQLVVFLQGLSDLKVNQRLDEFRERVNSSAYQFGRGVLKFNALMSTQSALMTLIAYFAMWIALRAAIPLVHIGIVNGLLLAGIALGVLVSFEAFLLLPQAAQHFASGQKALSRLAELVRKPPQALSSQSSLLRHLSQLDIRVEELCFYYDGICGDDQKRSGEVEASAGVEKITFSIHAGKRLGIVGHSGGGKTTLLNLLIGMLEPQKGKILLDGRDLRDFDLSWWRSYISSCGQDDYVFQATILENLLLCNPQASEEQIWQVLDVVRLTEMIQRLPQGLQTNLGEHGKQLSGGERQRLLLARTLLRDSPLYLFDEPTANLDLSTGIEVVQGLLRWTDRRAVIFVSHQAICFDQMDEILVLENGRITQRGRHEELLKFSGYYSQLWWNTEARRKIRSSSPRVVT